MTALFIVDSFIILFIYICFNKNDDVHFINRRLFFLFIFLFLVIFLVIVIVIKDNDNKIYESER